MAPHHVMTQDLISAFPSRPVKLLRAGAAARGAVYVFFIILLAIAIYNLWHRVPGVLRDLEIQKHPVTVPDASIRGSCTVKNNIYYVCNADIAYRVDGQTYQSKLDLSFATFSSDSKKIQVTVVRSA